MTRPLAILSLLLFPGVAFANADKIANAMKAGPPELAAQATIRDWDGSVLRKGMNGWTCLPDMPRTKEDDPWCVDASWLNFLIALRDRKDPTYTQPGLAYRLTKNEIVLIDPDPEAFKGLPRNESEGGPWVMWDNTPYRHLMVPLE